MSKFIKTSVTLTKDDKQFIESNSISLSKFIRQKIKDQKNSLSLIARQTDVIKSPMGQKGASNV